MRPLSVCYCPHLPALTTRTRVVFLQHPRERDVGIGTARMAHLGLPGSELHVGVEFGPASAALRSIFGDPARPPALLYPGPASVDLALEPPPGPITLVVVDGTWAHARSLVRRNPAIAALPRYTFVPPRPSDYRIRREPRAEYLSTIESLAHVLGVLEGDPERFAALHAPFSAMVEAQLAHARSSAGPRHRRRAHGPAPRRPRAPTAVARHAAHLVCVVAEANAWPHGSALRGRGDPGELVHLVAVRLATGERFEAVVAPRAPLCPATPFHTELSIEQLRGGEGAASFLARWREFLRAGDVLVAWGTHSLRLLEGAGAAPAGVRIDLRLAARVWACRRVGTVEAFHAEVARGGALPDPADGRPLGLGRGGRRLRALAEVTRALATLVDSPRRPG